MTTNTMEDPATVLDKKFTHKCALFDRAMKIGGVVNYTPHAITVAGVTYPPSGVVARVDETYVTVGDRCMATRGKVTFFRDGQPFPLNGFDCEETVCVVSAMVLEAMADNRHGVWVAPATGHPDVTRNEKGHIVDVPCFRLF